LTDSVMHTDEQGLWEITYPLKVCVLIRETDFMLRLHPFMSAEQLTRSAAQEQKHIDFEQP
jgi:hypothetical protein